MWDGEYMYEWSGCEQTVMHIQNKFYYILSTTLVDIVVGGFGSTQNEIAKDMMFEHVASLDELNHLQYKKRKSTEGKSKEVRDVTDMIAVFVEADKNGCSLPSYAAVLRFFLR